MKISRIIFISFFTAVALFLLSFMKQSDKQRDYNANFTEKNLDLPAFSHVKVSEGCNVSIKSGASNVLHIAYNKDQKLENPVFEMNEDTLIIKSVPGDFNYFIDVYGNNMKSLTITKARVDLDKLDVSKFYIESLHGEVYTRTDQLPDTIVYEGISSHCRLHAQQLRLLDIKLQKSECHFFIEKIEALNANLKDTSELSTQKVLQATIQADESSRYFAR